MDVLAAVAPLPEAGRAAIALVVGLTAVTAEGRIRHRGPALWPFLAGGIAAAATGDVGTFDPSAATVAAAVGLAGSWALGAKAVQWGSWWSWALPIGTALALFLGLPETGLAPAVFGTVAAGAVAGADLGRRSHLGVAVVLGVGVMAGAPQHAGARVGAVLAAGLLVVAAIAAIRRRPPVAIDPAAIGVHAVLCLVAARGVGAHPPGGALAGAAAWLVVAGLATWAASRR